MRLLPSLLALLLIGCPHSGVLGTDPLGDDDDIASDDDDAVDDDDTAPDDDDTAPDDDDAVDDDDVADDDDAVDDDDTAPDDDDTAPDDDDTAPDDDDAVTVPDYAIEMTILNGETEDFGAVGTFTLWSRQVRIENVGTQVIVVSPYLVTTAPGLTFTVLGPPFSVLTPFSADLYEVVFNPSQVGVYSATLVGRFEPANGTPPGPFEDDIITFTGEAFDPVGEADCGDGLDDDGDGAVDCDDVDCAASPECAGADPCCFAGDSTTFLSCLDGSALSCACNVDPFCCAPDGFWDATCSSLYANDCGAFSCQ